jgi:TPR repeat protein
MNKIQTLLTTTVLLFGMSGSGVADFNDGYDAYQKGDYKTAFNEWKPLAEQGDVDAQYNIGWLYRNGKGVLKDYKEAVKWYRKAAEQGDAFAQGNLGVMYANGKGVLKDYKEAVKWYRKAAEQGNASAQYNLGARYAYGEGVLKDLSKAKYWIKKAYENPDAEKTSTVERAEKVWNQLELWKY